MDNPDLEKLGRPTGVKITHETTFYMYEKPNGEWLVEIKSNIDPTASMTIRKEHMRQVRDMLNKAIQD
jgi:hypothetical protein